MNRKRRFADKPTNHRRFMKKSIFAVIATLCMMIGTGASAQNKPMQSRMMKERPTVEQMAQRKTDRMKEQLALTDEQAAQVYKYNLQQIKEMQMQREQMRKAQQAETAKMKSILTPEQFKQWQEMQGHKGHHKMQQGDNRSGKRCQEQMKHGKDRKGCCCDKKKGK